MAKKKISKPTKRRLTILMPIVFLALGYLLFTISTTAYQLYKLHHEEAELKQELKSLKGDSDNLKNEITKLQDKDYVARYARENYLYTKDGEYVIKDYDDEKTKEEKSLDSYDEYIMYGAYILGFLVVLYIIVKSHKKKKKKKKKKKS